MRRHGRRRRQVLLLPRAVAGDVIMTEFYLLDAGWLFFAALSVVIAAVTLKAFANDLFPPRTPAVPAKDIRQPGRVPEPKAHAR